MLTKNYRSLVPAVTEKLSVRFSPNLLRQSGYSCHLNAAFSWCAVSAREGSPRGYTAASISCREEGKKTRKFESVSLERTEGRGWGWWVLLVFLCLSLCLTAETRTAAVHLLYGENILPQSPRAVESSLPAQTLHRTKVPVLQVFIFDEERAQSASELLGPDLFSSTRTKLPNSETFPSFPLLLSLIFSGTSRWSEMISLARVTVTSLTGCPPQTSGVQFVRAAVSS